ncbi:unnamed protein product [Closterium sp. NIES-64]|nr:unnamed protein product [Closterium sp. NIES-64]
MATVAHLASLVPRSHRTITAARNVIACLLFVHTVIALLFFNLIPLPFATPLLRPTTDVKIDDLVFLPSRYDIGESNSSEFTEGGSVPREVEEESGGSAFPEAQAVDAFMDPQLFSLEELARREVLSTARSDMLRRIDDELRHDDSGKRVRKRNKLPPRIPRKPSRDVRKLFRRSDDSAANERRAEDAQAWSKSRLGDDQIVMVLLVHNRPAYLRRTLASMRRVEGIQDVLLIVSHDGYYPKMDAMVRAIDFCPVKQIYFPFSPHLFNGTFPAASPSDCQGRLPRSEAAWGEEEGDEVDGGGGGEGPKEGKEWVGNCSGQADQFGRFRDPRIISLKHHWWWAMNAVWGGMEETRGYGGHVVWVEEDHLLFPNALRHLRALLHAKHARCPHCIAANLAPSDVVSIQDDEPGVFSAERMGNVGYAFNRSVWELIHAQAKPFCLYDDYNWDLTLWSSVLRRLPSSWSLRWSRASAHHVGSCGLHSGQGDSQGKSNTSAAAAVKGSGGEGSEKDGEEGKKEEKSAGCSIGEDGIEKVQLLDEDHWMMVNASAPVVEREEEKRWTMFQGWVCLDGSAPGFYYRRGHGSGANKWLLNFRSGAWCTSPWDCYNRSSSLWGSSNHFPDVLPTPGILSAQSDVNPDMHDWNLVIFPYCDGASFSGDRQDPLVFEGVPLYSRGRRILDFLLAHLTTRFHMGTAQRVLISGCSAGALVVYLHCDYIRHAHMPPSASVQCLADSGLFLDIPDISGGRAAQTLFRSVLAIHVRVLAIHVRVLFSPF